MAETSDLSLRAFLVGQSLVRFDFRPYIDEFFPELLALSRGADVFFSNLEAAIASPLGGQRTKMDRYFVAGQPEGLDSLKALGMNLLALSNNHSYDMGPDGILATREEAGRRGFVHAGTGLDLEEAAAPVYLDTPHGIVALVAMASGGLDLNAPATASRPGINELRVDADGAIDPNDLERNLSSVREAASRADYVLVYQHNHYWEPDWQDPPGWQRAFARQCVDAGAVAFVGHGAPIVQAVELYEGRPIFYSLGNFIFQLQPDETFGQERVWQSVVADVRFRGKRLASMQLYPIVLNMELRAGTIFERTGLPCPATGKLGSEILERAAGLSRAFGTNVRLADNYAEIRIEASTNMKALKE